MPKMIAMTIPVAGAGFQRVERDLPAPGRHEVRIRVQACGVCHSDSLTVQGLFPGISYPRTPGHEVIGVIDAIGPDVDGWTLGERVGVGWFSGSCGTATTAGAATRSPAKTSRAPRAYRATAVMPRICWPTPRRSRMCRTDLDPVESAPLLCAGITTFNALRNCGAGPGDVVAVHGVGGLGHLGIQFAARQGFRTVAINRGRDKEALARSLGAQDYIDSDDGDPAQALTAMGGAKAIIATVTHAGAMQAVSGGLGVERHDDGDRRGRQPDGRFAGAVGQAGFGERLVFGHRVGFGRHDAVLPS